GPHARRGLQAPDRGLRRRHGDPGRGQRRNSGAGLTPSCQTAPALGRDARPGLPSTLATRRGSARQPFAPAVLTALRLAAFLCPFMHKYAVGTRRPPVPSWTAPCPTKSVSPTPEVSTPRSSFPG